MDRESPTEKLKREHEAVLAKLREPGPTLALDAVLQEPGNKPAERLLDQHAPEASQKFRNAEHSQEEPEPKKIRKKPSQLRPNFGPNMGNGPSPVIPGVIYDNNARPVPTEAIKPARDTGLFIETNRPEAARNAEPMPHERLMAKVEQSAADQLMALAKARQETRQEMDKTIAPERGIFPDYSQGMILKR